MLYFDIFDIFIIPNAFQNLNLAIIPTDFLRSYFVD